MENVVNVAYKYMETLMKNYIMTLKNMVVLHTVKIVGIGKKKKECMMH